MRNFKIISIICAVSLVTAGLTACGSKEEVQVEEEVEGGDYVLFEPDANYYPNDTADEPNDKPMQNVSDSDTDSSTVPDIASDTESDTETDMESDIESDTDTQISEDTDDYKNPFEDTDDSGWLDSSWFDDAVFIGDSITLKLNYYNDAFLTLGDAKFVCAASLGYGNAQWDLNDENAVHPFYNGEYVLAETAGQITGANKIIVGLGMNDIGGYGVQGTLANARTFFEKLTSNSPNARIYVESVTPMINSAQYPALNNDAIREFNTGLKSLASEMGFTFLNTNEVLTDEGGNLPVWLCSDPDSLGIHFTNEACEIWTSYLRSHIR